MYISKNLMYKSFQEKELLSLKSSFNTSKKDLMSSLKNREESCKTQYDSHIEILKAFYNDKLIRIEKQSSLVCFVVLFRRR